MGRIKDFCLRGHDLRLSDALGPDGNCRECRKIRGREMRRRQGASHRREYFQDYFQTENNRRDAMLQKRYGIDSESYDRLFTEQRGLCAICGKSETAISRYGKVKLLSVDHDHATAEVRGLLCARCNTAIGMFGDDIEVLESAIKYLRGSIV